MVEPYTEVRPTRKREPLEKLSRNSPAEFPTADTEKPLVHLVAAKFTVRSSFAPEQFTPFSLGLARRPRTRSVLWSRVVSSTLRGNDA